MVYNRNHASVYKYTHVYAQKCIYTYSVHCIMTIRQSESFFGHPSKNPEEPISKDTEIRPEAPLDNTSKLVWMQAAMVAMVVPVSMISKTNGQIKTNQPHFSNWIEGGIAEILIPSVSSCFIRHSYLQHAAHLQQIQSKDGLGKQQTLPWTTMNAWATVTAASEKHFGPRNPKTKSHMQR